MRNLNVNSRENIILKARNLSKNYGLQLALKNVSFELKKAKFSGLSVRTELVKARLYAFYPHCF